MTKRPFDVGSDDDDIGILVQNSKRRLSFKNVVGDVLRGLAANDFMFRFEPLLRRVVREEVESLLVAYAHSSARPKLNQIEQSGERAALQLLFVNKLPPTIFTGSRLEAEEGGPIRVVLLDPNTNSVVTTGPLSAIKIEILALDGDFGADDQDSWSEKEFNTNIVREREGKRPLVTGDTTIILKEGVGSFGEVVFTDNSSWLRSRKFRLGARIVQKIAGELRIREARSEAFVVKDHRGELYKKHYPPHLNDEVWRLERIAKEGAFHQRLAKLEIHTVGDFLRQHEINSNSLRNIFGGISNRIWEQIVDHATQCVPDDKLFSHHISSHGVGLVFNTVYKLVGAAVDGQNYQPLDELTLPQKMLVEKLKRQAYENIGDWVQVDEQAVFGPSRPLIQQVEGFAGPNLGLHHHDFSITNQEHLGAQLCGSFPSTSTSYSYEAEDNSSLETPVAQNSYPLHLWPQMLRNSFRMSEFFSSIPVNGENAWSSCAARGPVVPNGHHLAADDDDEFPVSSWSPVNANWGQGATFSFGSKSEPVLSSFPSFSVRMSRVGKPRAAWCKIRAAIKFRSVGRGLAARRMARPLFVDY